MSAVRWGISEVQEMDIRVTYCHPLYIPVEMPYHSVSTLPPNHDSAADLHRGRMDAGGKQCEAALPGGGDGMPQMMCSTQHTAIQNPNPPTQDVSHVNQFASQPRRAQSCTGQSAP